MQESDEAEEAMVEPSSSYGFDTMFKNAIEKMNKKEEVPENRFLSQHSNNLFIQVKEDSGRRT